MLSASVQNLINGLSGFDLLKHEIVYAKDHPEYLIDSEYLDIKTKDSELIPLKLNRVQRYLFDRIKEIRAKGKPVRIWLLKFRQGGCSTFIESLIFSWASQRQNINALIMADQGEKSENLFEMSKLFQERLALNHQHLIKPLKKSNEKKLEWDESHSQIIITTAENEDAARSYTFQYVHLSEVAFFRNLNGVLKALMQTVPSNKNTIVIGETTANGLGGDFYYEWQRAKKGQSDWEAIFIPWFWMEEYQRQLEPGDTLYPVNEGVTFDTDGGLQDFVLEEGLMRQKFGVTDKQLNWRRWCIVNNCKGEVATFRQEYPSDDTEAFLVTGNCVFDKVRLKAQKMNCKPPLAKGNIVELDGKSVFRDDIHGEFKIYDWPRKEGQYCIGGDSTRTLLGDPAAGVVLDKESNKTVAILHGHIDPDQFAVKLRLLGMFYNHAYIGPENNDAGHTTCDKLFRIYGNMYLKANQDGSIKELGWKTTSKTRPQMIAQFKQEIREGATDLMDEGLIDECLSFIKHENGDLAGAPGCHDDLVLARMIAGMMRQEVPFVRKVKETTYKDKDRKPSVWAA